MELSNLQSDSSAMDPSAVRRLEEIAEQKRIREMERQQQAEVEMQTRSPEQSAGHIVDQIV